MPLIPILVVLGIGATGGTLYLGREFMESATKAALVGGGLYLAYKVMK